METRKVICFRCKREYYIDIPPDMEEDDVDTVDCIHCGKEIPIYKNKRVYMEKQGRYPYS